MGIKPLYETIDHKTRRTIMIALLAIMVATCLDATVTTTCGPVIGQCFGHNEMIPWLTTSYLLLETIVIPIAGKLSDQFGRKKFLTIGLCFFGISSFVAGIAQNMEMMIVARAIQGVGGGILVPVITASVSDLYSPEDRGQIQGIIGATIGVGTGLGPLIGGAFADLGDLGIVNGWQLAFLINIPIVLVVMILCGKMFPHIIPEGKKKVDYLGMATLSTILAIVVMYFHHLGTEFVFTSIESIICILCILVLLVAFYYIEHRCEEPVISPAVFHNRIVVCVCIIYLFLGAVLVVDEIFTGLYLQEITGHSASQVGMMMTLMVVAMIITSIVGGKHYDKMGPRILAIVGTFLMTLGFFSISFITVTFNNVLVIGSLIVCGSGMGFLISALMTTVQNNCNHDDVGMFTSTVNLVKNLGSTIAAPVFTLLMNTMIFNGCQNGGHPEIANEGIGILNLLGKLGADIDSFIKSVFTDSLATTFLICSVMLIITIVAAFMIRVPSTPEENDNNDL